MKSFSLKIITCEKIYFDGECQMVVLPTTDGEMGILANHDQMAVTVDEGEMRIKHLDGSWQNVYVKDGIVEVGNNLVNIIVFFAESPENVEILKAREEYERANEEMMQKQSIQEYESSQARMARALAKLKKSNQHHIIGT